MPDYKNGKIYKLTANESDLVYYGSTCQPLHKRAWSHKSHYERWKIGKFTYLSAFELYKTGDPIITLVERFPCKSIEELKARERHWIENNPCVNKYIPGRTHAEKKNQDDKKKYKCECGGIYNNSHKTRHMATELHKLWEAEKNGVYLEETSIIECDCGGTFTLPNKNRHLRTHKHMNFKKENIDTK